MTIGVFPDLSIKEARKIARELKRLMAKGIDPREVKRQQQMEENEKRIKERERKANNITFKELCYKYIEEYAKIYIIHILYTGREKLQEYIIMGNRYF
ncbi:hypothetical protein OTSUT76_2055 [Orientia tsutsugamushi str. UT76]|uniref:Integrase n=2 Tax=Orientia tsutsugamushi TaxID=784 RepID=A0A2U3RB50_ORITS|nr:hypothetical protein OTSUT76_2055 [Orientia tsutsugamushi str. UT76]SPR10433.1 integrase [Orientia tsutsugamushi]